LHLIVVPQLSSGWQHNYSANQGKRAMPMSSLCVLLCLWKMQNIFESQETNFTAELYMASSMGEIEIYFNTGQLLNQNHSI
jgi:hypothetical protein